MNKRVFKLKRTIAVIIAIAVSALAFTVYLTWPKHGEFKPAEVYAFVELPVPETKGLMSVEEAIWRRRSIRSFTGEPLRISEVSQLLWAAQGITDYERKLRAAPSAGATYPLEVYLVVSNNGVVGLAEGLYHYDPFTHRLEYTLKGDLRFDLTEAAYKQSCVMEASISIVLVAVYERTTSKYGERGIRYVQMEAGHVGQNLYLQATALGLGMVTVGAFNDDEVQEILQLSKEQKPLYIIPVGHPKI